MVPGLLNGLFGLIGSGLAVLLAYGGLAGAVVAFLARLAPGVPAWLSSGLSAALLCVSVWHFSALHHDRQVEVERLSAVISEQARQREAAEAVARRAQGALQKRILRSQELQELIDDYESGLASGAVEPFAADDDYSRGMRSIRIGRPSAGAAEPAGGSDVAVPGSRPDR